MRHGARTVLLPARRKGERLPAGRVVGGLFLSTVKELA